MPVIIVAGDRPNCEICGLPMESWNPWAKEHRHVDCIADQLSDRLAELAGEEVELESKGE